MPGATSCIDALAHALCDRGDVIITPTPSYGCIFRDVNDHAGVIVEPLNLVQVRNPIDIVDMNWVIYEFDACLKTDREQMNMFNICILVQSFFLKNFKKEIQITIMHAYISYIRVVQHL